MGKKLMKSLLMYSPLQMVLKYCRYHLTASNGKGHGIHSPFVYDLVRTVLNDHSKVEAFARIEMLRNELLRSSEMVDMMDMGAGSFSGKKPARKISSIASGSAKPRKLAQLLFRLARRYKAQQMIELGTSLGISTAYLSMARPEARIATIEGSPAIAALARTHFTLLGLQNISVHEGHFDEILPSVLAASPGADLIFVDGNHRKAPTIRYFEAALPNIAEHSVMIFDDIHWSPEMEAAWQVIKDHPSVMLSVDIFFMGLVFFRPEFKVKQHFTIRY